LCPFTVTIYQVIWKSIESAHILIMYSQLSFTCNKCHTKIYQEISVPDTNMEESEGAFCEASLDCPVCGKTYDISVNNRGSLVLVTVDGEPLEHGAASTPYLYSDFYVSDEEWQCQNDYWWYSTISQQTVHQYFSSSMESLKNMLSININDRHQTEVFNRMLLVQSIATMEAYLSDTLISRVITDPLLLKQLFEIDRELKQEKYTLSAFLNDKDLPKKRAKEYLSELVYHNLPKVEALYKNVLGIRFDFEGNNKEELFLAIQARHNCVHRNGKTEYGGNLRLIDKEYILKVIKIIEQFVFGIEQTMVEFDDIPF
ncbi:MAG: hypothetical protein WAV82_07870, partial [Methylobacter sp.]